MIFQKTQFICTVFFCHSQIGQSGSLCCWSEFLKLAIKAASQRKRELYVNSVRIRFAKQINFKCSPGDSKITSGGWIIKQKPLLWRNVLAYHYIRKFDCSSQRKQSTAKMKLISLIQHKTVLCNSLSVFQFSYLPAGFQSTALCHAVFTRAEKERISVLLGIHFSFNCFGWGVGGWGVKIKFSMWVYVVKYETKTNQSWWVSMLTEHGLAHIKMSLGLPSAT